ncbi:uncharacterized protein V1513DRAFT_456903 [Lipomyces chichibuensis]|uniref:uncharacterized protein n=1 Tax=Lipomyces chichibuensis TaxID=1546026 RepID=UPI003343B1E5
MSVTDAKALSNYNEAFTLLKENTPEQRLDVQLPYDKYLELDDAFSRLKLAEGISEDQRIFTYVEDYLSTRSPHTVENIRLVGSTTQYFHRDMTGTGQLVIAIEVGTSETYDKLLEDKDMWIENMRVNVFILICFKESPLFKNPDAQYKDIAGVDAEKVAMTQSLAETIETNITRLLWSTRLKEAFIEVWQQHSHQGFAIAHNDLPVTLELKISDFYPVDTWQTAKVEEDSTIPFDCPRFLRYLMADMGISAQNRLARYTRNWGYVKTWLAEILI